MRVLIFSHESDIDGLGNIVLGQIAFKNMDYFLAANPNILEEKFREYFVSHKLHEYDMIYITDLALLNPMLDLVANDPILSKRVHIFDHHKSSIDLGLDKYDFTNIKVYDKDGITCGTKLFYNYLVDNEFLEKNNSLDDFVELTRLEDTWEWKKSGEKGQLARNLAILLSVIGIDKYIKSMYQKVTKSLDGFAFTSLETKMIETKKKEIEIKVRDIWNDATFLIDEDGNDYAIVCASIMYIGDLSEYVRSIDNHNIKYFILVDLDKKPLPQKSYRQIDEEYDVSITARKHGGGGHVAAAAACISEEQKEIALKLLKKNKIKGLEYLTNCVYK